MVNALKSTKEFENVSKNQGVLHLLKIDFTDEQLEAIPVENLKQILDVQKGVI